MSLCRYTGVLHFGYKQYLYFVLFFSCVGCSQRSKGASAFSCVSFNSNLAPQCSVESVIKLWAKLIWIYPKISRHIVPFRIELTKKQSIGGWKALHMHLFIFYLKYIHSDHFNIGFLEFIFIICKLVFSKDLFWIQSLRKIENYLWPKCRKWK